MYLRAYGHWYSVGLLPLFIKAVWSHFLPTSTGRGFRLEKTSVQELFSFGKWIFLSTAMMFLATQSDRLLLGKIFPMALFGVYNIAVHVCGTAQADYG